MKTLLFTVLIAVVMLSFSCQGNNSESISFVKIEGKKVPQLDLAQLDDEVISIGLSDIAASYKIISLETKEDCMIEYARPYYTDDFLLISTQHFPNPAPLYMFDHNGKFIREIGRGGNGPGEHSGYLVETVIPDPENKSIFVRFIQRAQLFDYEGNFVREMKQPLEIRSGAYAYDDNLWFSPGRAADYALSARDSVLLVFFDNNGKLLARIDRKIFPPASMSGYTPSAWDRIVYKFDNKWKIYLAGLDTLYTLSGLELEPDLIIKPGSKGMKYNKLMSADDLVSHYDYSVFAETDNYYFLRISTVTKAELVEWKKGSWGGGISSEPELLLLDKKSFRLSRIGLNDDIFGLRDKHFLSGAAEIFMNRYMLIPLNAVDIHKAAEDVLNNDNIDDEQKQRLLDLKEKVTLESNPVILLIELKDRFDLK